jgi:hypothetical protein
MIPHFRYFLNRKALGALALVAGAGLLDGCRHDTVVPVPAVDYYPLVVGTYRAYAVTDTVWNKGVATPSTYQFREAVTEQFTDAAGKTAYRVVRSRRASAAAAWADDSALVVQPLEQAILLTRNNIRTVELIYPLQANKSWKKYAFTTNRDDSIRTFNSTVAQPFTTPAPAAKSYESTVIVRDRWPESSNDGLYKRRGTLQVFALGLGPVARRRYYQETFFSQSNGAQVLTPGVIQVGYSHLEVLLDSGKL